MRWSDLLLQWSDRYRRWAIGLLLLVYLAGFNGQWRPEPDSALYLALARNVADGQGYTYHDKPHHLAYPGWPYLIAGAIKVFGHEIFIAHVLVFLMGLASLGLMYRLMLLHAGRSTAVLMTVGLGISFTFYRYCFEVRSDMPFMLGVMGVLAGYEGILTPRVPGQDAPRRHRLDWLLLGGGMLLALATRPTAWPLLAALVLAVGWAIVRGRLGRKFAVALIVIAVGVAAFVLCDPRRTGGGADDYENVLLKAVSVDSVKQNFAELMDPMASEAMFGLDFGKAARVGVVSLQTIGSMAALLVGFLAFRERALWGLWFLLTVLMMIMVLARDRYFLPLLPVMIYGWWIMIRQVNLRLPLRSGNVIFVLLFAVGAVGNSAKIAGLMFEQRHRNVLTVWRDGRYESMYRVAHMIDAHVPPDAWVIGPKKFSRILSFLSHRNVTEPRDIKGQERTHEKMYLLDPAELDPDSPYLLPGIFTIGPPIKSLKGPYDAAPWTLHAITLKDSAR